MGRRKMHCRASVTKGTRAPASEPLSSVIVRIAEHNDARALRHLNDYYTPFLWRGDQRVRFAEYLLHLCSTPWAYRLAGGYAGGTELAYDIVVDRFGVVPDRAGARNTTGPNRPECGRYYRPVLRALLRWRHQRGAVPALEEEVYVADLLQRHVIRHFRLACAEARRQWNPARTRFSWKINGHAVTVWLPRHLSSAEREAWLTENAPIPEPAVPGEVERIQAIIDRRLGTGATLSIERMDDIASRASQVDNSELRALEEELWKHGLGNTVANEKGNSAQLQRPAIRALGASGIRDLVRAVFESLVDGSYDEKTLAKRFALSPSALSRFAGSRWQGKQDSRPPDLWLNCAHLLANVPDFTQAARSAGVLSRVQETVSRALQPRMRQSQ